MSPDHLGRDEVIGDSRSNNQDDDDQHSLGLVLVMEGACAPHCELSVPLVVETGWSRSWDEAH
jgi:DNA polymerase I-like protein with 3'-5' exonuclease and polymerase domains